MCAIGLGSAQFDDDVAVAVAAAERLDGDLAVVLVQAHRLRSERRRRRLVERLHTCEGFVYDFGDDCFALLLPGSTAWDAFRAALSQHRALRTRHIAISAGVAGRRRGEPAAELTRRAADALARAEAERVPVWLERHLPTEPISV